MICQKLIVIFAKFYIINFILILSIKYRQASHSFICSLICEMLPVVRFESIYELFIMLVLICDMFSELYCFTTFV